MQKEVNEIKNTQKSIIYPKVSSFDVMKEYAKLMRPHTLMVFLIVIGVLIAILSASVIAPLFYKKFFDLLNTVSGDGSMIDITPLTSIVFIILFINIINWIGWRVAWFSTNYLEGRVMANALQKAFDYTIYHSHSFFLNNFSGSLVQRINRFTRSFDMIFENIFYDLFSLIIKVVGTGIVLYITLPIMAYAIGAWIIIFLTISFIFAKIKLKYDVQASEMNSKITGMLSDSISNHNSVQSFSRFKYESNLINKINTSIMKLNIFRWNFGSILDSAQAFLGILIEFSVFYFGIKFWQSGLISLGTFVLVQSYILIIGHSLWSFSRVVRNIYQGVADAKEMVEILYLPHEIKNNPDAKKLIIHAGNIEFKNVSFVFDGKIKENKNIFENLSFSIRPGEKVAIIGSSGAGKSTLIKLLLRLYDIQTGEIIIDGQNIKKVTEESLRENISLVPQDTLLFHRTLMENIRYGKHDAKDEDVIKAAKLAHCDEFINSFTYKYETYVGERGIRLSGGERQRVAIARAILKNAPILILDEATSSLDSHSESLIQDAFHTLMKDKTTIVIAHRLSTIRKMDRIIVMDKGKIVEEGSHDELKNKEGGIYSRLWLLQAGGFENKSIEELFEEKEKGI